MTESFGEYMLDCMEKWARENPDKYVNPNMLMGILSALSDYQQAENDYVDEWFNDMWGM